MKTLLISLIWFLVPSFALAWTGSYCVSGAGTAAVNGTYTYLALGNGAWVNAGCTYMMYNAGTGTITPCSTLTNINFAELRSADNSTGYYYDSVAITGTVETFNTINSGGSAPIPTVTQGACASPFIFHLWFLSLF